MATTYLGKRFRFTASAELGGGGMARVEVTTMSSIGYKERALELPAVLDDCIGIFIADASVEPSTSPGRSSR